MDETEKRTARQISESEGLEDWRVLLRSLQASFRTGSMAKGVEFAARIGAAADEANHHPDLTITYPRSTSSSPLTTPTASPVGMSSSPARSPRSPSSSAIPAEPTAVSQLEIAIDALDIPAVKPFWEAVLGYKPDQDDDSVDPYGRAPRSGSSRWMPRARSATASTSTSPSPMTSPSSASPRRWRRAAPSSPTPPPPRSGFSPIPRATRRASARGRPGTELREQTSLGEMASVHFVDDGVERPGDQGAGFPSSDAELLADAQPGLGRDETADDGGETEAVSWRELGQDGADHAGEVL